VIQPQVPLRLPCYDFTPITNRTLGTCLQALNLVSLLCLAIVPSLAYQVGKLLRTATQLSAWLAQQLLVQSTFVV